MWIALTRLAVARTGRRLHRPQFLVVVDRNPAVPRLAIVLADAADAWQVIGSSKASKREASRRGYFITPTGVSATTAQSSTTARSARATVAVDFSRPSVRAAELAADVARARGAELVLLTVVEHLDSPQAGLARIAHNRYPNEPATLVVDEAARADLCLLGERLTAATGSPVACRADVGEPAETIPSFAERNAFDLIAMGHTGHNRLVGTALGSVAKCVIDTAVSPVLVVRL